MLAKPITLVRPITRSIVGFLVAAVFALSPLPGAGATDPPFRVMMVLWRGCEDACRGFQDYLNDKEIPVDFLMRDVKQEVKEFPNLVAEARALDVDLVVTWGTTATLGIVSEFDKVDPDINLDDIPVLFMIVTDPLDARVVPNLQSSGRNVSGTLYLVPETVQMRAISSYLPFDKVGIVYNTNEVNAVISADKMRAVAAEMGFTLVTRTVPNDADGRPIPESLPGLVRELAEEDVDLIYLGSSSFILLNRDAFTAAALEVGLPVAAAGEVAVVESNALLGLVSRYYNVGQLTAERAEQILVEGRNPADIPIESLSRFSLIVNMQVARKLDLFPPMSLLNIAEVIKTDGPQPR